MYSSCWWCVLVSLTLADLWIYRAQFIEVAFLAEPCQVEGNGLGLSKRLGAVPQERLFPRSAEVEAFGTSHKTNLYFKDVYSRCSCQFNRSWKMNVLRLDPPTSTWQSCRCWLLISNSGPTLISYCWTCLQLQLSWTSTHVPALTVFEV